MKFLDETGLKFIATKFKELRESLANKVDKVENKQLSTNDYTNEAKAKVDAIPTDPKYTDTVQDLSEYAKKREIPTEASQLENDISLINSIDFPFFDTLKNPTNVNGDWNATPFSNGVRFYHSKEAKNSPNGDGIYIVFTSFELVEDDNAEGISSKFYLTTNENFEPCMVAYHLQSGNMYVRNFTIDKKPEAAQFSPGWFEDGIKPISCSPWIEITKDFAKKDDITKAISTLTTFKKEIVTSLPSSGQDNVFYLLKDTNGKDNNNYLEYLWIDNKWEMIGSTQVDLSRYVTKDEAKKEHSFLQESVDSLNRYVVHQDNNKANRTELKTRLSEMKDDATHRLVTDAEKTNWSGKIDNDQLFVKESYTEQKKKYGDDKIIPTIKLFRNSLEGLEKSIKSWANNMVVAYLKDYKQQIILTQTEYNALSSTDKNDSSKIYFIKG